LVSAVSAPFAADVRAFAGGFDVGVATDCANAPAGANASTPRPISEASRAWYRGECMVYSF
jgi:hypothetical protein